MGKLILTGIMILTIALSTVSLARAGDSPVMIKKVVEVTEVTRKGRFDCEWVNYNFRGLGKGEIYAARPNKGGPLITLDYVTQMQIDYFNKFCKENKYPVTLQLDERGILFIIRGKSIEWVDIALIIR